MFAVTALAANAVARMTVRYGALADLLPLTEVTIYNRVGIIDAFGGTTVLVADATDWGTYYDAGYSSGQIYWNDIERLVPVVEPAVAP